MKISGPRITHPFLAPLGIIFLIACAYFITRESAIPDSYPSLFSEENSSHSHISDDDSVLINAERELAHAKQVLNTIDMSQVAAHPVVGAPDTWAIEDSANRPAMPVPAGVSIYEPVSVDMENPQYPAVGSRLDLTLPGGGQLKATVETVKTNPNGDYTWTGHLDGHGSDEYPVVMTYGANSVFATITTPDGSYTLESVDGSGWIYKNPSEFELSHAGANDYLEIPHEH